MRTIKFKGTCIGIRYGGNIACGSLVACPDGTIRIFEYGHDGSFNNYRVDPDTVCQFTGLIDCEGNELFEHDLIHIVGFNYAAELIWSEGCYAFMVVCENKHSYCLHSVIKACKIERIVNKFDKEK